MTNITISGMTQEQFQANVKTALENHSGSPVTKKHLVTKAVTTILGQGNEHTVHQVFDAPKAPESSCFLNKKPVGNVQAYESDFYYHEEYSEAIHGKLDVKAAKAIIDIVYASRFWFLAPLTDGIMEKKEEALSFVEQFPGHPLVLVTTTNSSSGTVSALINNDDNGLLLRSDDNHDDFKIYPESLSKSPQELMSKVSGIMTKIAANDYSSDDYYAIPYLLNDSPFIDYVNGVEYLKSEYGSLDTRLAKQLVELVYQSDTYIMGTVQGVPFESKQEALLFTETFDCHAMAVIAPLFDAGEDAHIGASLIVTNDNNAIYMADSAGHDGSFSESVKSIQELKEKLPALAAKIGNADFPNYGAVLTTKSL